MRENSRNIVLLGALVLTLFGFSTKKGAEQDVLIPPPFLAHRTPWADSIIQTMSLEEKIGQLFMIPAYSNGKGMSDEELNLMIDSFHVGGIIFMQGGPGRQANLNNRIQERSKIPMMVAMDAEWGLGMRLDSTISYPWQMALGATRDKDLIYEFGGEAGRQLRRMGVHISFSPVVDVNNNPENPVINARSFGEDVELVSELGTAYMRGLQDNNVLACAKHFPGHGDTDVDSHKDLPVILHDIDRLNAIEHRPFSYLIDRGLGSAMVAHLYIPALDTTSGLASTLSSPIVHDLLQVKMGFKGLIFTDALTMQGVAKYHEPGDLEVKALLAGNDVLLFPTDVAIATQKIKQAIADTLLTEARIDQSCLKILRFKEWSGITDSSFVETKNLWEDLNNDKARGLHQLLAERSLSVVRNQKQILPIKTLADQKIAVLTIGENKNTAFTDRLSEYLDFDKFQMSESPNFSVSKTIAADLKSYDLVIVSMLTASRSVSKNYGVNQQAIRVLNTLAMSTNVLLCAHNNPYALGRLQSPINTQAIVVGYHDDDVTQKAMADGIVGSFEMSGKLPVTASDEFNYDKGIAGLTQNILRYVSPAQIGIDGADLARIDTIIQEAIEKQAFPGCRIIAARHGDVFLDKSYGFQTYEGKFPVDENTIYDLASITKIAASTLSLMKMQDEGKLSVDYNLCDYLDICDTSDYYNMNLTEMLSHHARLKAWIPFYLSTIDDGQLRTDLYSNRPRAGFSTQVADQLYIRDSYTDSVYNTILETELRAKRMYKYSDLGYYFIKQIIEQKTGMPLEEYVDSCFYKTLHLSSMGYLPLQSQDIKNIAPTEYDLLFRKQLVHGHVHDPGAAMMGGVGGHAGLFSNAYDLTVLMQMLAEGGNYGGKQIIEPETIDYFTSCHFCDEDNRRGIGFDKPTSALDNGPTCNSASALSFGHSGFTGTLAWADPEHDIVYVFLSNRVYPDADNRKLITMDIRTRVQQVIYDAFEIPARQENQDVVNH